MTKLVLLVSFLVSFSVQGFWGVTSSIEPKTALQRVEQNKAVFLDVREAEELKGGQIKDALNFPTSKVGTPEWDKFVTTLPKDKTILTYCAKGGRAGKVADDLKKRGYKVENAGGFERLKSNGAAVQ